VTPAEAARLDATLTGALPAESLYAVGGRVRDELRAEIAGVAPVLADLDYVVLGLPLVELVRRLDTVGRTAVVGAAFAVVKCTIGTTIVDVALPRRERSTGVGHRDFDVEAGPAIPLPDDLARRDFRMNMLARAVPSGELVDPFAGAEDIRAGRIDLLRPEAFEEDPLRMLRACQFAARFGYTVTAATMDAMRASAPLAASLSAERVRDELFKLLSAPRPSIGFEVMREGGLLPVVLPELAVAVGVEQNEWHAHDVYYHTLATVDAAPANDPTLRLAALLHDVAKPQTKDGPHFYRHEIVGEDVARALLGRLRLPNDQVETVARLVRGHMYSADPSAKDATIRRFVRRVGPENLDRLFALRAADIAGSGLPKRDDANERFEERVRAVTAQRPPLGVADLAIGGEDVIAELVARGVLASGSRGGPQVGRILRELLDRVTDDPAVNDRAALLALVGELATQ
jgi:tRNA nucleotidyltransferase (CCA-adding enzyme)